VIVRAVRWRALPPHAVGSCPQQQQQHVVPSAEAREQPILELSTRDDVQPWMAGLTHAQQLQLLGLPPQAAGSERTAEAPLPATRVVEAHTAVQHANALHLADDGRGGSVIVVGGEGVEVFQLRH
jgi:hypothetical protein